MLKVVVAVLLFARYPDPGRCCGAADLRRARALQPRRLGRVPPQDAIAIMRKAGLKRALVSSSGDDGQQRLFAAAPDLVIPSCAPTARAARSAPGSGTRASPRTWRSG